jgi:hypothetical protein
MGRPASSGPDCGAAQGVCRRRAGFGGAAPWGCESGPPWGGTSRGEGGGPLSPSGWNTHLVTAESRRLLTESLVLLNAASTLLSGRNRLVPRKPTRIRTADPFITRVGVDVQSRFLHALDGLEGHRWAGDPVHNPVRSRSDERLRRAHRARAHDKIDFDLAGSLSAGLAGKSVLDRPAASPDL